MIVKKKKGKEKKRKEKKRKERKYDLEIFLDSHRVNLEKNYLFGMYLTMYLQYVQTIIIK